MAVVFEFNEVLIDPLPKGYDRMPSGGPEYANTYFSNSAGFVKVNVDRYDPINRFRVDYSVLDEAMYAKLRRLHIVNKGGAIGFRFKDWTDYFASADGLPCDPHKTPMLFGTGNGSRVTWPLIKTFTEGSETYTKQITKPVAGGLAYDTRANTVKIYVNGTLQTSGVSVNSTTGIVTFTSAPANSAALTWLGEYDLPVRFGSDSFAGSIEQSVTAGALNGVEIIEILPVNLLEASLLI